MVTTQVKEVLISYPYFKVICKSTYFLEWTIVSKSQLFVALFASTILLSSILDHTMVLGGINVGLLEHPTIWIFLLIQWILPGSINKVLTSFFIFLKKNEIVDPKIDLNAYFLLFTNTVNRKTNFGRLSYSVLTSIGLMAFIWNSYQNQQPFKFLGFDFWDSIYHSYGYWVTRVYKICLWVIFLPAAIHLQVAIIFTLNKFLKDAKLQNFIELKPYHYDSYGGAAKIIDIAIKPFIPILIIAAVGVLSTLFIHNKIAVTPFIGLFVLSFTFSTIYLVPALILNKIIKTEKKRQLTEIAHTQNLIYYSFKNHENAENLVQRLDTLNAFEPVIKQIKSISNWPYLSLVVKLIGLTNMPIIISIVKQCWPSIRTWIT